VFGDLDSGPLSVKTIVRNLLLVVLVVFVFGLQYRSDWVFSPWFTAVGDAVLSDPVPCVSKPAVDRQIKNGRLAMTSGYLEFGGDCHFGHGDLCGAASNRRC